MSLLSFLGSNLYRGWNSDALILFIYLVHSDMRLLANVSSFATLRDWSQLSASGYIILRALLCIDSTLSDR